MNIFLHYFRYYYRVTDGRIVFIIVLALAGTLCHGVTGAMLYAVLNFTTPPEQLNFLAKTVFAGLNWLGVVTPAWRLAWLLIVATLAAGASGLLMIYEEYFVSTLRAVIAVRLQSQALTDLLKSRYEYVLSKNTGYLNNIIVSQIRVTAQSLSFFGTLITHSFFAALYLAMPFFLDYKIALSMVLISLPALPVIRLINRRIRVLSVRSIKILSQVNEFMLQTLGNVKYLKSTETYPALVTRFTAANQEYSRLTRNLAVWSCIGTKGLPPFAIAVISLLIFWKVFVGGENPMDALLVLGILYAAAQKAITIPTAYQKFIGTLGAIMACEELERELTTNREPDMAGGVLPDFTGELSFEQVDFQYATSQEPVLRGLSLRIPTRSCVAIVGGSGAGKSTVVNLITGLLRPTAGDLRLGRHRYSELNLEALRANIGYVTQEAVIFGDTVRENLRLWQPEIGEEQVLSAAQKVHADVFIKTMPQGYDTILGSHGFNISGGQRQRLAIAREILRQTPMLILDEATSALDSESERLIQENIREFQGSKTMIIIAHRLSTVRHCDCIFVLDQGTIVEQGTYDELYRTGGIFRRMVDRQAGENGGSA